MDATVSESHYEDSIIYYVGSDIAKLNYFASVISSDSEVLVKPFKFTNNNDGFCKLLSMLAPYE